MLHSIAGCVPYGHTWVGVFSCSVTKKKLKNVSWWIFFYILRTSHSLWLLLMNYWFKSENVHKSRKPGCDIRLNALVKVKMSSVSADLINTSVHTRKSRSWWAVSVRNCDFQTHS